MKFNICFALAFLIVYSSIAQPLLFIDEKTGDGKMMMRHPERPFGGNPPGNNGPHGMLFMDSNLIQKILNELTIDKNRSEKILSITRNFQTFFESKIISIQREELDIKEELLKDKPDMDRIQTAISRKSKIFAEIEFAQIKRDIDIKSILTLDEFEKWKHTIVQSMRPGPSHRMLQEPERLPDSNANLNMESGKK